MSNKLSRQLNAITKMSENEQRQHLRMLARVDTDLCLDIFKFQKQLFHQLRQTHSEIDKNLMTYASLILAVEKVLGSLKTTNINASMMRARHAALSSKKDRILSYWPVVKALKQDEGLSFRDIAAYLYKYHRCEVAHTTLWNMWNELECTQYEQKKEK